MVRVRLDKHLTILTNDPSFTAWGYVVIKGDEILECDCIKTAPDHKKKRIRKSDDTVRRIQDINIRLLQIVNKYSVDYILSELPHGSQNAQAALMMGAVPGMLQMLSDCLQIPIEWYSEMDSKKALLGKKSATKQETIDKVKELFPALKWKKVKYVDEAVADAMSIYYTALKLSPTFKLLK
jgi:Holliday junction resolvasome RuvABC endonuclease subunit